MLDLRFIIDLSLMGFISLFTIYFIMKQRNFMLMILVPLVVALLIDSYRTLGLVLGSSSRWNMPTKQVVVLAVAEEEKWIHLWYVDPESKQPRAVKLKNTEENKKAAQKMNANLKRGQNSFAEVKKNKATRTDELVEYSFSTQFQQKKNSAEQE